jgi:hypothetical protein
MSGKAGPGVGFEYPPIPVSWLKRDLLLFAASIGATYPDELHYLYVNTRLHFTSACPVRLDPQFLTINAGTPPLLCRLSHVPDHPTVQAHRSRSHRLLRAQQFDAHRWRAQVRHQGCAGWRAQNPVLQGAACVERGADL